MVEILVIKFVFVENSLGLCGSCFGSRFGCIGGRERRISKWSKESWLVIRKGLFILLSDGCKFGCIGVFFL